MILRKPSLARCLTSHAHRAAPGPELQGVGSFAPTREKISREDKPIITAAEEVTAKRRSESAQIVTWLKETVGKPKEQTPKRSRSTRQKRQFAEAGAAEELGRLRARVSGSNEPEPWAGSWGKSTA
jgi:hypothetical protein